MGEATSKFFFRSLVGLAICLMPGYQASAQLRIKEQSPDKWLLLAEDQYRNGAYRNAWQSSKKYLSQQHIDVHANDKTAIDKAGYIAAASALSLNETGGVEKAIEYLKSTANPAYRQRISYAIGQYYFRHNELRNAIPYYEEASIYNLSNREVADSKFELAYCYFNIREFDKAEPLLLAIKEVEGKYYIPGNYYYGLLAYNKNDYTHAMESFSRIAEAKEYKDIVPYYIAEIYYFTGEYDKALSEAKRLLARPEKLYYNNELHLLAAQVLFEQKKFYDALPYFEYYYEHTDNIRKEDLYEMAYCYYDAKDWEDAIDKFRQLSNSQDSLGQTAMYLLGDCYLKMKDNKSARNAFSICAGMPYNQKQREAALLLAAKLSYEMGYNDEAITHINDLLTSFPGSPYQDEAKTILSDLLIKTNQYATAYKALHEVSNKSAAYNRVLQKVTFGYAMQKLQSGNIAEADELLTETLQHSVDNRYTAAANFWKGEIAYKMRNFPEAIQYTERFVANTGQIAEVTALSSAATLQNAYINMGYAAMEQKDFQAAQGYFSKVQGQPSDSSTMLTAVLREADAVFMQKGYLKAIALYDRVIAAKGADADYAKYQKALILGVLGKRAEESAILASLMNANPPSAYADDARYEQATIYIDDDKYQQAINTLQPLTTAGGTNTFAAKAWMKTGFAYHQMNADDKAIEAYKHVITDYPSSEERAAALDALKALYIERNQPDVYAKFLRDNNIAPGNTMSLDSAYYNSAENQFASGKWAAAKQGFTQYLEKYPDGAFVTKAYFYKAESHTQLNETPEALAAYDAVLKTGWNDFTERSAARAAAISFRQKNYTQALSYYTILRSSSLNKQNLQDAYTGMMRSSYELKNYNDAATYADTLASLPEIDEHVKNEAILYKARALFLNNKPDEAYPIYKQLAVSKQSAIAAEANYRIAEVHYKNNRLKEAEEAANASIKLAGGDDKMVVANYLLLADILTTQKDFFNAKALLQSIVKNAKSAEIKQQATDKLKEVKELESKNSKLKQD